MNLVEVWFGIIERQAIHRGTARRLAKQPTGNAATSASSPKRH
jgi:hypothetical protein